jgi:concanavalin A-like lectin/glucanase superfamily protein
VAGMSLIISAAQAQQLRVYPAVELEFATETFRQYQLQGSVDLADWMNMGAAFEGTGDKHIQFVSTRESGQRFFRLRFTDRTPGLVAYYPFNGDGQDASTSANHGIIHEAALTTNRFGFPNAALQLSGTPQSYVQVADSPSLAVNAAVTMAAWINFEVGGEYHPRILHKQAYELFTYETTENRRLAFAVQNVGLVATPTEILQAGRWTFVAATYDGSALRLYVDGTLAAETSATGAIPTPAMELNLGRNAENATDNYRGILDDVRLYNRALSSSEIANLAGRPN